MSNPYEIEGPALISFSGGRTSAYMLKQILDSYGGVLPPDVLVCFANTGKERQETLAFITECGYRWRVRIYWLEYRKESPGFEIVSLENCSKHGEPFAELIQIRQFLPNPITRFCTTELKISAMKKFMLSMGHKHWDNVVGLRADEPSRVAKMRNPSKKERWENILPLADAGVTEREVLSFWADNRQGFDLRLRSYQGNCDLCFLKGQKKIETIIRENPASADWWIQQESRPVNSSANGGKFRKDRASYAQLKQIVADQVYIPEEAEDNSIADCFCTD